MLATTLFAALGSVGTGAVRFAGGACVLLVVVRPSLRGRSREAWLATLAFGAVMAAMNFLLYAAIARIPLGTAVTLEFLGPTALALLGARRRSDVVWTMLAVAGVVLLTGGLGAGSLSGALLAVGAGAAWAGYLLLSKRVGGLTEGLDGLALSVTAAAVLSAPISVVAAVSTPRPVDLLIAAGVGVLGIVIPYSLELLALRRLPVKTVSTMLSLDPAIAATAGAVALGQTLSLAELTGILLVMTASAGAISAHAT
ncbi:MAG: EamA family transporter [Solirubrobacteraceae bacterium]